MGTRKPLLVSLQLALAAVMVFAIGIEDALLIPADGFIDLPISRYKEKRKERESGDRLGDRSALETNDNSESDDDFDPETGEVMDEVDGPGSLGGETGDPKSPSRTTHVEA